jgi:hypothetical protein
MSVKLLRQLIKEVVRGYVDPEIAPHLDWSENERIWSQFGTGPEDFTMATPKVTWVPPDLEEETGEFERIVDEGYVDDFDKVMQSAKDGQLVRLDLENPLWRNMENADSGQDLTLDDVRTAGKNYGRDVERILKGFERGAVFPAPIVLEMPDGSLHNVAGNTRLMVCRALRISPMVWWIKHPKLQQHCVYCAGSGMRDVGPFTRKCDICDGSGKIS